MTSILPQTILRPVVQGEERNPPRHDRVVEPNDQNAWLLAIQKEQSNGWFDVEDHTASTKSINRGTLEDHVSRIARHEFCVSSLRKCTNPIDRGLLPRGDLGNSQSSINKSKTQGQVDASHTEEVTTHASDQQNVSSAADEKSHFSHLNGIQKPLLYHDLPDRQIDVETRPVKSDLESPRTIINEDHQATQILDSVISIVPNAKSVTSFQRPPWVISTIAAPLARTHDDQGVDFECCSARGVSLPMAPVASSDTDIRITVELLGPRQSESSASVVEARIWIGAHTSFAVLPLKLLRVLDSMTRSVNIEAREYVINGKSVLNADGYRRQQLPIPFNPLEHGL